LKLDKNAEGGTWDVHHKVQVNYNRNSKMQTALCKSFKIDSTASTVSKKKSVESKRTEAVKRKPDAHKGGRYEALGDQLKTAPPPAERNVPSRQGQRKHKTLLRTSKSGKPFFAEN